MHTQNQEDYLRIIYKLYEKNSEHITSVDVSSCLKISKPAVSKMLKKLVNKRLLKMTPYSDVVFTAAGLREAKKITHRHRVIEVFLVDILRLQKHDFCKEAHLMEHAFSQEAIRKLANFLNNPKICPCGKAIPYIK